jgi:hypothetical protein
MTMMLAVVIALAIPVTAQYGMDEGTMRMWNVRAGLFFPAGDTVDSSEFTIGIEHEHPADAIIKGVPGFFSLTVDWTQITTTVSGGGTDDVTLMPILVNWKQHSHMTGDGRYWDYGGGIGVFWARDDIPDMRLTDKAKFAWQLMAAYHLTETWFLEGRFLANNHPGDDALWALELGYSF